MLVKANPEKIFFFNLIGEPILSANISYVLICEYHHVQWPINDN